MRQDRKGSAFWQSRRPPIRIAAAPAAAAPALAAAAAAAAAAEFPAISPVAYAVFR